jgi:DNA-binding NarL/FixJ family response regulator
MAEIGGTLGAMKGSGEPTVRLLIVEDHPAIGQGLAALFGGLDGIEVVGVASDGYQAAELIRQAQPQVVLCDVMLGSRDAGFELLHTHRDAARFIMYSAFDFPAHHARAIAEGAAGYLSKGAELDMITRAVKRVARGGQSFGIEVLASARKAPPLPNPRELALLELLAAGMQNEDIGARLDMRVKTVEGTIRRLFDRYGVENRTQLARLTLEQGWLASEEAGPSEPVAAGVSRRGTGTARS